METAPAESEAASPAPVTREPTALFVNTASRVGEESFQLAREKLSSLGLPLVEACAVDDPSSLPRLVAAAVEEGVRRVIVGGGDGTLSAVAHELVDHDVRMAVLPLGTGNDFARSIGIPLDLDAACEIAARGRVKRVDVGMSGERVFLNAASIGLSTAVTRRLSDDLKRRLGRGAFALVAASEAWTHRPFRATLETDERSIAMEAHQVVIANGRFHGGGQLVAPEATHEDRRLDVYVIHSEQQAAPGAAEDAARPGRAQDLWNLFRIAVMLRRGRHIQHPAVTHLRVSRVRLVADPPLEVDVDGELHGHTPMEFHVRPAALQVLVPRQNG